MRVRALGPRNEVDFSDDMSDILADLDAHTDAVRAVRAVAVGKSRNEIRALLLDELRSRGVTKPEPLLENDVKLVIEGPGAGRARLRGRPAWLPQEGPPSRPGMLGHLLANAQRLPEIQRRVRSLAPQYQPGWAVSFLGPDRSLPAFEVILEPDARQWLVRNGGELAGMPDPGDRIDVWLDSADPPSEGSPVRVHVRDSLAGVLSHAPGAAFWTATEAAHLNHSG